MFGVIHLIGHNKLYYENMELCPVLAIFWYSIQLSYNAKSVWLRGKLYHVTLTATYAQAPL